MQILIVGGAGFIGYHTVRSFLRDGHQVTVLSLPPCPMDGFLPPEVEIHLVDLNHLEDRFLLQVLKRQDGVVFAAGADDRIIPKYPAYRFFYLANVKTCVRFFRLAREAGVQRGVLLGSYFSYFDRIWPEMRLSDYHPYIRSRREQEEQSIQVTMPDLELILLELPYIFGATPGHIPIWKPLLKYIGLPISLFYTRGGTNITSVQTVANAIVKAMENGKGGERYLIGSINLSWIDLLERLACIMGIHKKVVILPNSLIRCIMRAVRYHYKLKGQESGLEPVEFVKLQIKKTYFDPKVSQQALGYLECSVDDALQDTVRACFQPGLIKKM